MPNPLNLSKITATNPKVWIVIGVGVAGIVILAETRRRRLRAVELEREDFGAFVERFELLPFPQPPPPAARLPLSGLSFAIKDVFDVKDYVTGFGSPCWKKTHEAATKTAVVVTTLLKNGATCVGKTVMDELAFGITGENVHFGTPSNPQMPLYIPGGSSSGSAVAVASELVDFALGSISLSCGNNPPSPLSDEGCDAAYPQSRLLNLALPISTFSGTDTIGCVRIPASFCGILGFRPSHGVVSANGVLPSSQSLDTVGMFARHPSVLHRVGHILLQLKHVASRRTRRFIIADDLFQLSKVPKHKTVHVVSRVTENLSGYQPSKHANLSEYIASNVTSLKGFREDCTSLNNGITTLNALSSVMFLLQRYEFKMNHEEWVKTAKPKFGPDVSDRIHAAIAEYENIKILYKVRTEIRAALHSLLKDDGILVIPTIADPPLKLKSKKRDSAEFHDRAFALQSIASMSGCCQVTIPLGKHDDSPISVSLIACHGADKFLLDTVLDAYSSFQEQSSLASNSSPLPDMNGDMDAAELLKEKGNAAYKGKQWNKAASYYTEAIKLNEVNATYYCNRAVAYLQLGCFQEAEEDCNKAILLDKQNVKAYLRRGAAREACLSYKEALLDFKHALVLEPQNKVAALAEKRLRKLLKT